MKTLAMKVRRMPRPARVSRQQPPRSPGTDKSIGRPPLEIRGLRCDHYFREAGNAGRAGTRLPGGDEQKEIVVKNLKLTCAFTFVLSLNLLGLHFLLTLYP